STVEQGFVLVTHPFHPWFGQRFELQDCRQAWGEDRVYVYDGKGQLRRLPASWTDARKADPFVELAAGRAWFRPTDLIALSDLVDSLSAQIAVPD
ncbi:MAG: DUF5372 family protein, partial [Gammaproteobacteria bacterium]